MGQSSKSNIVLTGMSGAGKSTIGVLIAKSLGKDFVDTDLLIQKREGRLLQEIIDQDGIGRFLEIEEDVLVHTPETYRNAVIATGGSAVYSEKAMRALAEDGVIVYLDVPCEEILRRLTNITTRGIVLRHGNTFEDAYNERLPLYRRYSDLTIDCSKEDIEQSVGEVLAGLRGMGFGE